MTNVRRHTRYDPKTGRVSIVREHARQDDKTRERFGLLEKQAERARGDSPPDEAEEYGPGMVSDALFAKRFGFADDDATVNEYRRAITQGRYQDARTIAAATNDAFRMKSFVGEHSRAIHASNARHDEDEATSARRKLYYRVYGNELYNGRRLPHRPSKTYGAPPP